MKTDIGVAERTGLVPSGVTTAANVADVTHMNHLLRRKEKVFGDAGYTGASRHARASRGRVWHIAAKRSTIKAINDQTLAI